MDSANCITVTTGGTGAGNGSAGYYPNTGGTYIEPYYPLGTTFIYPVWNGYWYTPPVEPQTCIGKAHVFECAHERTCKCGAVERIMAKPKKTRA